MRVETHDLTQLTLCRLFGRRSLVGGGGGGKWGRRVTADIMGDVASDLFVVNL